MSTCRCGAWVGHPEARTCTILDCELRGTSQATDQASRDLPVAREAPSRAADDHGPTAVGGTHPLHSAVPARAVAA